MAGSRYDVPLEPTQHLRTKQLKHQLIRYLIESGGQTIPHPGFVGLRTYLGQARSGYATKGKEVMHRRRSATMHMRNANTTTKRLILEYHDTEDRSRLRSGKTHRLVPLCKKPSLLFFLLPFFILVFFFLVLIALPLSPSFSVVNMGHRAIILHGSFRHWLAESRQSTYKSPCTNTADELDVSMGEML